MNEQEHIELVADTVAKVEHKQQKEKAIETFVKTLRKKYPNFNERKFKRRINETTKLS